MVKLWFNGHIYTMNREGEKVEAIVTEDGKIIGTGTLNQMKTNFSSMIDDEVDLQGSTLLPGFVDSHMHLIGYGEAQIRLDLSNMKSKQEVLNAVTKQAETLNAGEWLIGEGWNENLWEHSELLTKEELDRAAPNNPVMLKRVCRHAIAVNSQALKLANITKETANPEGGVLVKDQNGELTGYIKDNAQELINRVLPAYDIDYLKKLLKKGIESCYKLGLTGAHTEDLNYYGSFFNTYEAFKQIIEQEGFAFRAHLLIHHGVIDEWKESGYEYLGGSQFVKFGPMKIFADGSLGGRTALLSFPYADDQTTNGVAIHSYKQLHELVKKARSFGLPVAVHAIGDLSFEWILDAIEKYPLTSRGRDRLIHAQLLRKEMIGRIRDLPVILDIQPRFLASDFPWVLNRIGEGKIDYVYAWKSLLDAGIHCAGGSDAPIEHADPLLGIHAAVTRSIPGDLSKTVYIPEERLSVYEAVSLFTKGSAYASLNEGSSGMIKENFIADFTVLDQNIFEIDPEDILSINVKMTVVDGNIVYKA